MPVHREDDTKETEHANYQIPSKRTYARIGYLYSTLHCEGARLARVLRREPCLVRPALNLPGTSTLEFLALLAQPH